MKVAALQMNSGDVMDENLAVADGLIGQAVEFGAELVVLPENFSLMTGDHEGRLVAAQRGREVRRFLSELAKKTLYFAGGGFNTTGKHRRKGHEQLLDVWHRRRVSCTLRQDSSF